MLASAASVIGVDTRQQSNSPLGHKAAKVKAANHILMSGCTRTTTGMERHAVKECACDTR